MIFDFTISLGNVISAGSIIATITLAYAKNKARLDNLTEAVAEVKTDVKKLQESDTQQAVLSNRVLTLETEAKISSLSALVQRVNYLEKELNRIQELESFRRQNEQTTARR